MRERKLIGRETTWDTSEINKIPSGTIILFKCIYRGTQFANLPFDKSNLKFRERRKEVVGC